MGVLRHLVAWTAVVLVCLSGWSYVSRAITEATAMKKAACAAHETPHGSCTNHDQRHVEDLEDYCQTTERQCDKSLWVATAGRVAHLVSIDTIGVESRSEFGLWLVMALSSPATWSVLLGLVMMCVIVSYAKSWMGHGDAVVKTFLASRNDDDKQQQQQQRCEVALPVATPVTPFRFDDATTAGVVSIMKPKTH